MMLCRIGLHRWKRLWKDGESREECARCGKLRIRYGGFEPAPEAESDD